MEENLPLLLELNGRGGEPGRRAVHALLDEVGLSGPCRPRSRSGSRGASSSAWRWPARWSTTPTWCSPTSRPATSISTPGARSSQLLDRRTRQAGKTLVMATHASEVAGLADRTLRLQDGRLVAGEPPADGPGRCSAPGHPISPGIHGRARSPSSASRSASPSWSRSTWLAQSARRALSLSADAVAGSGYSPDHRRSRRPPRGSLPAAPGRGRRAARGAGGGGSRLAAPDFPGRTFQLIGVDPFAEAPFRPRLQRAAARAPLQIVALLVEPRAVVVGESTARDLEGSRPAHGSGCA